jgi:hypothetical protein
MKISPLIMMRSVKDNFQSSALCSFCVRKFLILQIPKFHFLQIELLAIRVDALYPPEPTVETLRNFRA